MKRVPSLISLRSCMIILALSTNLTACSLLNPYVNSSELKFVDPKAPDKESQPCSTLPNDMQEAVNCAHVVQSKYVENMGEQAMLSSVSGVGLISLTAYTAGIAINDAHTTNVTDFALGASAIYGMSQWLSQPERTKIYGLGIKAVQCAVDASVPFQTNSANMKQFDTDVKNLRTQIKYTSRDLETVKVLLDSNTQTVTKLTELDKAKVTSARQSIDEARTSATTAGQLIASYNHAPFELVATVNRINASVNAGLGDSIQSMSALPGTLSGILDMYSHLESGYVAHGYSPEGETKNGGAETEIKKAEIPGLAKALSNLDNSLNELAAMSAEVELGIATYTPKIPKQSAEACGVDLTNLRTAITFVPTTVTFGNDKSPLLSVQISGGSGSYVSSYDDSALEIKHVPPFGPTLQIKPKDKASRGTYNVTVEDTGGGKGILSVIID